MATNAIDDVTPRRCHPLLHAMAHCDCWITPLEPLRFRHAVLITDDGVVDLSPCRGCGPTTKETP